MAKPKQPTKADLQRQVMELKAQLAHTAHFAAAELHKASTDHMMASAVILQLHALGGREIVRPVAIQDGLSPETIQAIHRDLIRTYELATMDKPAPVKGTP